MREHEFYLSVRIERHVVETWIDAGWIVPREAPEGRSFSAREAARVELIRDLKESFGVNDEGIDVILRLVDQVYGLRRSLRQVLSGSPRTRTAVRRIAPRRLKPKDRRATPRKPARPRTS